jgi:Ca2+-binding RTX toxin-like protein
MANITGTDGNDTLTGTAGDDTILGLGGNDQIIATAGSDIIDGGVGNDVLDYSNFNFQLGLRLGFTESTIGKIASIDNGEDKIKNVETIIGSLNPPEDNIIQGFELPKGTNKDIDLSKNLVTYFNSNDSQKLAVKNFNKIAAGDGNNRLKGNDSNNFIEGGEGNDFIIGTKGNDTLVGGNGNNTLDYSNIDHSVNISASWYLDSNPRNGSEALVSNLKSNKSDFETDSLSGFQKIIAPNKKTNTFDASASNNIASLDVNLVNNSIEVHVPPNNLGPIGLPFPQQFELINFVNVVGSKNNDKIVGANKKGELTGGGGNDTITGGSKNDRITGTDGIARGVGEVDILTGGGGRDQFILGDTNGAYYVSKGKDDYALITDFNLFQDSISIGNLKNYSFAASGNNTIDLYSGKDINTRDLIAKIQFAGGISAANSNSHSVMEASSSIDIITSKIDTLSGASSTDNS